MPMEIRLMDEDDIPDGMRFKESAGWNQTPADWERFLRATPLGCFKPMLSASEYITE